MVSIVFSDLLHGSTQNAFMLILTLFQKSNYNCGQSIELKLFPNNLNEMKFPYFCCVKCRKSSFFGMIHMWSK